MIDRSHNKEISCRPPKHRNRLILRSTRGGAGSQVADRWRRMPPDLKRRFQSALFPDGVTYVDERFGTSKTCPFMRLDLANGPTLNDMASPTGIKDFYTLVGAALRAA